MVYNLCENGIKYNKDGGWVRISINTDHKYFYVKVEDNGIGIPKEDQEHIESFSILAEKICRMCLVQSRVQAKVPDMSNEKYALRTWLNRLGMKGAEYKLVRRHLMENLSGHSAFRTEADEERARLKAKRAKDIIA